MKITLKNIKYAAFASEETHCYSATVFVDGVKLCTVSNDGHGGCDHFQPLKGENYARIRTVESVLGHEKIASSIKNADGTSWTYDNDLEHECGERMNEWHRLKEVKKILRRISYLKDGDLYQQPARIKPTPKNLELLAQAPWWQADNVIISGMTPDAAMKALTDAGFFGEVAEPDVEDFWCTCPPNEDRDASYVPDEFDNAGNVTSKHHWTCNTCGNVTQVG